MIVAEQKSLEEIEILLADSKHALIVGCGTCVTVCFAGGEKEAKILASALRMKAKLRNHPLQLSHHTIQRQCDPEYLQELKPLLQPDQILISLGCGIGVQALTEHFPQTWVIPALNTRFMGMTVEHGHWEERCAACGDCVLGITAGICPIARCSKSLLNGPCGGSNDGKCEISADIPCAWTLIYERLQQWDRLDLMQTIFPARDWSATRHGGPRRMLRSDLIAEVEEI